MPSMMVRSRLSGWSLCRLLLSASGTFAPHSLGPSPVWWQALQAMSNMRWAALPVSVCAALSLRATAACANALAWCSVVSACKLAR